MNKIPKERLNSIISVGLLISFTLIYFADGIFFDRRTIIWDTADFHYPVMYHIGYFWSHGVMPLWNSFIFNGHPSFADPQSQTYYPINILLGLFLALSPKVIYLQLVLHYALAGLFMFLLASHYIGTLTGRIMAALVYMFSGFMVTHFQHLAVINTVTWLPILLYLLEKIRREKKPIYIIIAGLLLGVTILAGHPQTLLYLGYALFFSICYFVIAGDKEDGKFSYYPFRAFIIICLIAISITAIQLIPSFEFSTLSNRSEHLTYEFASGSGQLPFKNLITMFVPDYYGSIKGPYVGQVDISQSLIYFGTIPLLMVGFALVYRQNLNTYFFFAMAVFSLLISMGDYGFIFKWLYYYAPGFNLFRSPVHFGFVFMLYVALLAGQGTDIFLSKDYRKKWPHYVYIALLVTIFIILYYLNPPLKEVYPNVKVGIIILALFFTAGTILIILQDINLLPKGIIAAALVALIFLDLYICGAHALTSGEPKGHKGFEWEDPALYELRIKAKLPDYSALTPPILSTSDLDKIMYRIYIDSDIDIYSAEDSSMVNATQLYILGYNRPMLHKQFMVDGYNPMILRRHVKFNIALRKADFNRFLSLSNVRYSYGHTNDYPWIAEVKSFLPRAYIVENAKFLQKESDVLNALVSPTLDIHSEVILEAHDNNIAGKEETREDLFQGAVKFQEYSPNKVVLKTHTNKPGYLVLTETYYPGWQAEVDGAPASILRANYCFRAVHLNAGDHQITFSFRPNSLKLGAAISSISMLLCLISIVYFKRDLFKSFRRRRIKPL